LTLSRERIGSSELWTLKLAAAFSLRAGFDVSLSPIASHCATHKFGRFRGEADINGRGRLAEPVAFDPTATSAVPFECAKFEPFDGRSLVSG
jgi:hypothetical protein